MEPSNDLINFFVREIEAEERAGFPRLSRIPDSYVMKQLQHYRSLTDAERPSFRDCCAHWAHAHYGFIIGAPHIDHTQHPFFKKWRAVGWSDGYDFRRNVPLMRAALQQHKIDAYRAVPSSVSKDLFEFASSIRSVKAPELRKRVRTALKPLGYYELDKLGYYRCRSDGREFLVHVDYGGRNAQLRYSVAMPEFGDIHQARQFCFERALGFGLGDWNYIVEENVADVLSLFADLVSYCVALPDRIRAETA